jgi:hypothetical protein
MEYISITEFRKNTKVILDAVVKHPVVLRRGDELYQLSHAGNLLSPKDVSSNVRPYVQVREPSDKMAKFQALKKSMDARGVVDDGPGIVIGKANSAQYDPSEPRLVKEEDI